MSAILHLSLVFDRFATDAQETSNICYSTSFPRFEFGNSFAIFGFQAMFRLPRQCRLGWQMLTSLFVICLVFGSDFFFGSQVFKTLVDSTKLWAFKIFLLMG